MQDPTNVDISCESLCQSLLAKVGLGWVVGATGYLVLYMMPGSACSAQNDADSRICFLPVIVTAREIWRWWMHGVWETDDIRVKWWFEIDCRKSRDRPHPYHT